MAGELDLQGNNMKKAPNEFRGFLLFYLSEKLFLIL